MSFLTSFLLNYKFVEFDSFNSFFDKKTKMYLPIEELDLSPSSKSAFVLIFLCFAFLSGANLDLQK